MQELTQDRLKNLLSYDHDTGIFSWAIDRNGGAYKNDTAGGLSKIGYITIRVDGIRYPAHRLAWLYTYGEWPERQIDHINHIRDDNRISNLRSATHSENGKNQSMCSNNTSGATGVRRMTGSDRWVSRICVDGEPMHLGCFGSFDEACESRKEAEIKYGFHENHGK